MSVAHDIYAETNPAFCTYALAAFTAAYASVKNTGADVSTAYIALPLALSGELSTTFIGTNKNTGLIQWLERNPQIQLGLSQCVNASMGMVTEAVRFACFCRVLTLTEDARMAIGTLRLAKSHVASLGPDSRDALRRSERMGYWFAAMGSTRAVFDAFGLTL